MPSSLILPMILFFTLFVLLEARSLLKRKAFKELMIASLILMLSLGYGLDYAFNWQFLPNPNRLLTLVKPLSEAFDKFFQVKA